MDGSWLVISGWRRDILFFLFASVFYVFGNGATYCRLQGLSGRTVYPILSNDSDLCDALFYRNQMQRISCPLIKVIYTRRDELNASKDSFVYNGKTLNIRNEDENMCSTNRVHEVIRTALFPAFIYLSVASRERRPSTTNCRNSKSAFRYGRYSLINDRLFRLYFTKGMQANRLLSGSFALNEDHSVFREGNRWSTYEPYGARFARTKECTSLPTKREFLSLYSFYRLL